MDRERRREGYNEGVDPLLRHTLIIKTQKRKGGRHTAESALMPLRILSLSPSLGWGDGVMYSFRNDGPPSLSATITVVNSTYGFYSID